MVKKCTAPFLPALEAYRRLKGQAAIQSQRYFSFPSEPPSGTVPVQLRRPANADCQTISLATRSSWVWTGYGIGPILLMDRRRGPGLTNDIASAELEAVASTFRSISDDTAFEDMLVAWDERLSLGSIGERSALHDYADQAISLLNASSDEPVQNPLEAEIDSGPSAAMVLSPDLVVVITNHRGTTLFSAVQGRAVSLDWLDPGSLDDIRALQKSARGIGNRKHAIIRVIGKDGSWSVAEAYVRSHVDAISHYIVVRSLELDWTPEVDDALSEAFGFTPTELSVSRMLFETRDSNEIARLRKTSVHTVRTQLRAILSKAGVHSQVDLVRLLGFLCARQRPVSGDAQVGWQDPWSTQRIVERPDGYKVAFSWTGDPKGKPVLLTHGFSIGYLLGEKVEARLKDAGIKLIAPCRPGSGGSETNPDLSDMEDVTTAYLQVLDSLKVNRCSAIGLGGGAICLFTLAERRPALFNAVLCVGDCLPISENWLAKVPYSYRVLAKLAVHAPKIMRVVVKAIYRNVRRYGIDWYLDRRFVLSEVDAEACRDPDLAPLIRNACELTFTRTYEIFASAFSSRWKIEHADISEIGLPIHIIVGGEDPTTDPEQLRRLAGELDGFTYDIAENAGELVVYQAPDLVVERMIEVASH